MAAYDTFIADPCRVDIWTVDISYWDASGAAQTLYFSTSRYGSYASDTPSDQKYNPGLISGMDWSADQIQPGVTGVIASNQLREIVVAHSFCRYDYLTNSGYTFDGGSVKMRHGGYSSVLGRRLSLAESRVIFTGELEQVIGGIDTVRFIARETDVALQAELQFAAFTGSDYCLKLGDLTGPLVAYIECGTPATIAKANLTGTLCIGARVYFDALASTGILAWDNVVHTTSPFNFYMFSDGRLSFYHRVATVATAVFSTTYLVAKEWYTVFVTKSSSTVTFHVLRESTGVWTTDSTTISGTFTTCTAGSSLRVGCVNDVQSSGQGIDWVLLRNDAPSFAEISELAKRQLSTLEAANAALILYYRLEEGTGAVATDYSPSPVNGTNTGAYGWKYSFQGGAQSEGRPMPDFLGKCFNCEPVLVQASTRIYCISGGKMNSIDAVKEGGAALTPGVNDTNWWSFINRAAPAAGTYDYIRHVNGTFIRLGRKPALRLTVDGTGNLNQAGTYVYTAADIVKMIVTERGHSPRLTTANLDTTSFTDLNTANSAIVGIYSTEVAKMADACSFLLGSVGAIMFSTRAGLLKVLRFTGPAGTASVTLDERVIKTIDPLPVEMPLNRVWYNYKINYTPLQINEMSTSIVDTATQLDLQYPASTVKRDRSDKKRPVFREYVTGMYTLADAQAEAERLIDLYSSQGKAFKVVCSRRIQIDRMDTVQIELHSRGPTGVPTYPLGLSPTAAKKFIVLGASTNTQEGSSELIVWRASE